MRADGGEVLVGGKTTARSTCSISPGEVVEVGTVEGINCGEPGVRALAGLLLNFEFSSGMIVVTTLNLLANLGPMARFNASPGVRQLTAGLPASLRRLAR